MAVMSTPRLPGQGLGDPVLLDKIDRLLAYNLGEYVNLPQLVVVGDQSSGKSSVLEGLTKLPFPRDSGLCTRFATHIIFRRIKADTKRTVTASIVPGPDKETEHASRLAAWKGANMESLDPESFAETMEEVHQTMGLSGSETDPSKPTFTQDVFRLEICGPEEDNLSIIDVPGIFKNTTSGLTTKWDMEMVKDMVLGYMRNPRSIMLTVVPANVDIATQEILEMARECDPEEIRTLGVLTKPDLVDKGAENKVIDLVEGKSHSLALGWIVVRNAGQQQLLDQSSDRDLVEALFFRENHPWSNLPKDKVGIHALKVRLQEVQTTQIRREFPKMRTDVGRKLKAMRHDLSALGNERSTPEQQRSFLLDVITRFQDIVSQAMTTSYGTRELFDKEKDTRLATIVRNRMEVFKSDMEDYGLEYQFISKISDIPPTLMEGEEYQEDDCGIPVRKHMGVSDNSGAIDGILHEQEIVEKPTTDSILAWIEDQYRTSRGFEVGTFPSSLLCTIMNRQSGKWTDLALGYVSDVIEIMHTFILKVLGVICPDEQICDKLVSVLADELSKRYREAMEQAKLVLDVERMNIMTLNDGFYESLEETQKRSHREKYEPTDDEAKAPMSNTESTVRYIHDILAAYYDVASKRFVDNICTQATGYFLLTRPRKPLGLFSPQFVANLTEDQLTEIAGENAALSRRRAQLKKGIQDLEIGRKIMM
ncbi:Dynamin [Penicillium psychrosexuale]|uniref:Dynamin n=1 Tax=Penicillium psychrosexuale TaxID=1002107 RepID=UPI002544EC80|nr:Dynamin [Penicillium psychrosexuale]KAJ5796163.1 Dynamin [Penicillium psychrosexuale]